MAANLPDVEGKKVVIVGTGNSGHDIAENLYENGAAVTMLQGRGRYALSLDRAVFMLHDDMHADNSPPTKECDVVGESPPSPVQFALNIEGTKQISEADKEILEGLERADFNLDFSIDGGGIAHLYFTHGGGYYVDVGCSKLIIDGKDQDGTELTADMDVLATGYDDMKTKAQEVMGEKVAARLKDV
ncbi:hypothetical protein F5Y16DRAFT_404317 [Xylariaceae sp. FL0255]|nr:hypothetical protein F5Y16DRAFT_404317 [Xylariaceae sp. FL0255]